MTIKNILDSDYLPLRFKIILGIVHEIIYLVNTSSRLYELS